MEIETQEPWKMNKKSLVDGDSFHFHDSGKSASLSQQIMKIQNYYKVGPKQQL